MWPSCFSRFPETPGRGEMLSKLKNKFGSQKNSESSSGEFFSEQEIKPACEICSCKNFWLPKNSEVWRCEKCSPPASEIFVSRRTTNEANTVASVSVPLASQGVHRVDRFDVTYCVPWCESCGSWQAIETWWSDDRIDVTCRVCRAAMPARPTIKPKTQGVQYARSNDERTVVHDAQLLTVCVPLCSLFKVDCPR